MQSQKIQAFNSQFTMYEGEIKGTAVKSLMEVAKASNVANSTHQVFVLYEPAYDSSVRARGDWSLWVKAEENKTYKVQVHYYREGFYQNLSYQISNHRFAEFVIPQSLFEDGYFTNFNNGEEGYIDVIYVRDASGLYPQTLNLPE